MRFPLRWRLLLLTVVVPAVLGTVAFVYLSKAVTAQVRGEINDSLMRAALVFDKQFAERGEGLSIMGRVIARDPRFFSAVALPGGAANAGVRATVRDIATDFLRLTHADMFEVWDRRGRVLASVGTASSSTAERAWLSAAADRGEEARGLLAGNDTQWQVTLTPVRVDGVLTGALLIGVEIGPQLAQELHGLTRGEVTFVSRGSSTGSSLAEPTDLKAVLAALAATPVRAAEAPVEVRGVANTWVTLARPLPGTRIENAHWFVIQRSLEAEMAFLRRAQRTLLMLALVAVVIAAFLGAFTAERITRPLLQLVRGAEAMERGDFDAPIPAGDSDEIGYLGARFRDMRSRERDYITSLEEVARLKSEFINVASHELRTPITVIKGYHDLFYQGALGPVTDRQQQALLAIDDSIEGLIRLTENATRIAQIEGERLILYREDCEIAQVVAEALELATHDAPGRNVTIGSQVSERVASAYVDGPRLTHAIANLVRNAIRFTPDGGHIGVRAEDGRDGFLIEVADNGIGIEAEQQKLLFSRAFAVRDSMHHHSSNTLDFRSCGLGLGLAIASGIVEAHGGTLSVQSEPGSGSVFTIHIPRLTLVRAAA